MVPRSSLWVGGVVAALLAASGCGERDTSGLEPWPLSSDSLVFQDDFGEAVDFQAFLGSNTAALSIDSNEHYLGTSSLLVSVPDADDPDGGWAGGAFVTNRPRDLTTYNALTFWAKSSKPTTLDVAGLANDNTGTSKYTAEWHDIPIGTSWEKYVIPIPLPEKLGEEKGLFFFAEGPEGPNGHDLWFDEVFFEFLPGITNPRPAMDTLSVNAFEGATIEVAGTQVTFDVEGQDQVVQHLPGYFTFHSSDPSVVATAGDEIRVIGPGDATVTAMLGDIPATGEVTVTAMPAPSTPAPTPAFPAEDVISLFCDAYQDVPVDTWSAFWDRADVSDLAIAGDGVKVYTNFVFAGVEFPTIDATAMSHFHLDVWAPSGDTLWVKLVDFGADGAFGGTGINADSQDNLPFTSASTPPLTTGEWITLDIPLSEFTGLASRSHLAQFLPSGNMNIVFVDNVLFHK